MPAPRSRLEQHPAANAGLQVLVAREGPVAAGPWWLTDESRLRGGSGRSGPIVSSQHLGRGYLRRAAALGSTAGGGVAGTAPPGAAGFAAAPGGAAGDSRGHQLLEERFEGLRFMHAQVAGCAGDDLVARRPGPTCQPTSPPGEPDLDPTPVGAFAALGQPVPFEQGDEPDSTGVGQPQRVRESAHVCSDEEVLERQQGHRRAAGEPRGALHRLLRFVGEVEREGCQEVVQPGVCGSGHPVII